MSDNKSTEVLGWKDEIHSNVLEKEELKNQINSLNTDAREVYLSLRKMIPLIALQSGIDQEQREELKRLRKIAKKHGWLGEQNV